MMKLRNTIILFIILLALSIYVYFVEIKQHEKKEKAKKESQQLFLLEKDSLASFTLVNSKGTFTVKKLQGEWRITDPLYTEAEESTINSMLTSLLGAEKDKEFSITLKELKTFGLSNGAIKVYLTNHSGEEDSVWFGDKTPVGNFVFGYKTDTLVFTVNQSVKTSFEKGLFDLRDKKLLHFKAGDVRKITVQRPGGTIEFEKRGSSEWQILGLNRPADNGKISSLLSKLENNKVKNFVEEEGSALQSYGLQNPAYQVTLLLGPEQGQKIFKISQNRDSKYFAKDEARRPVFEIDSALVKDLNQPSFEFRNKDLASFNRSEIDRISFQYGDTSFSCLKDTSNNWMLDNVPKSKIQSGKINSFFSNLDFTTISDFVKDGKYNPALYGLNNPSLTVQLYSEDEMVLEVKLGKKQNEKIYAVTDEVESVYLIPVNKLDQLKLKQQDIIEQTVGLQEE
jgi:hypothetical protein